MDDASFNIPSSFAASPRTGSGQATGPIIWRVRSRWSINHRTNYSPYVQPTTLDSIPAWWWTKAQIIQPDRRFADLCRATGTENAD
jgi:hypothetical protein